MHRNKIYAGECAFTGRAQYRDNHRAEEERGGKEDEGEFGVKTPDRDIAAKETTAVETVANTAKAAADAPKLDKAAAAPKAKVVNTPKAVKLGSVTTSIWDTNGNDESLETPEEVLFSPWKPLEKDLGDRPKTWNEVVEELEATSSGNSAVMYAVNELSFSGQCLNQETPS